MLPCNDVMIIRKSILQKLNWEVLDWMCLFHYKNFWKASVYMIISLEVLGKEISCNVSCLTSFHGGN